MFATPFSSSHRVGYDECTLGNHVYYARYLDLLERARGEFFRHLGKPLIQLQDAGVIFPVVEVRLKYHGPARYDDLLDIQVAISRLDRVRLGFEYRVFKAERILVLDGEVLHVCTSLSEKPQRIPKDLRAALAAVYTRPV